MSDKEKLDKYLADMDRILDRHIKAIRREIKQAMVEAAKHQLLMLKEDK